MHKCSIEIDHIRLIDLINRFKITKVMRSKNKLEGKFIKINNKMICRSSRSMVKL